MAYSATLLQPSLNPANSLRLNNIFSVYASKGNVF